VAERRFDTTRYDDMTNRLHASGTDSGHGSGCAAGHGSGDLDDSLFLAKELFVLRYTPFLQRETRFLPFVRI
jgi:hypothetical protein